MTRTRTFKREAGSIDSIVNHYLDRPDDRSAELVVHGVTQRTYETVFQRLDWLSALRPRTPRLYYGRLKFKDRLEAGLQDQIDVEMFEGKREGKKLVNPYVMRIRTRGWSSRQVNALLREVNQVKEDHRKHWLSKGGQQLGGWLFCLAAPDPEDQYCFTAEHPAEVHSLVLENFRRVIA